MEKQKRTHLKKRAMIEALEKSLGVVTDACKSAGVSRSHHYQWLEDDPVYAEQVRGLDNLALDFAESSLYRQIKDDNTTATIFYLKTRGKKRGYNEYENHLHIHNTPTKMSEEELERRKQELRKKLNADAE